MSEALYVGYGLTVTQVRYLEFICAYAGEHNGNSPGIQEAADYFNVAWSTARWHIAELSNKRLVQLVDSKIVVTDAAWEKPPYVE